MKNVKTLRVSPFFDISHDTAWKTFLKDVRNPKKIRRIGTGYKKIPELVLRQNLIFASYVARIKNIVGII